MPKSKVTAKIEGDEIVIRVKKNSIKPSASGMTLVVVANSEDATDFEGQGYDSLCKVLVDGDVFYVF